MINPVFRREAVTSLRSWRSFLAVSLYVLVGLGIVVLVMAAQAGGGGGGFNPRYMLYVNNFMVGFKLVLICIMVPAICAGTISGERERQTLELLLITKMSTFSIVMGKLLSVLMFVGLLIVAGLPVLGVMFYFGGFSPAHLFLQTIFMLAAAAMTAGIAILFSAVFRRSIFAIIASYLVLSLMTIGTFLFVGISYSVLLSQHWMDTADSLVFVPFVLSPSWQSIYNFLFGINPMVGFMSLVGEQMGGLGADELPMMWGFGIAGGGMDGFMPPIPFWQINILINIGLALLGVGLAAYIIKPVKGARHERSRPGKAPRGPEAPTAQDNTGEYA